MDALLLMIVCGVAYLAAYHTYGKFLAKKIFKLRPDATVPSVKLKDGIDYVPTKKGIIFGHHYTSIAGTGPIVGPAIGIIWGWLPAILWSMRNDGKSMSEIAARYINKRVRFIFFAVVFLTLLLVIAVFGVVIAAVFTTFPSSVLPVWLQIPIAVALGYAVYKKSANVTLATTVAVIGMYLFIALGAFIESHWPGACDIKAIGPIPSTGIWVIILLIYTWVASTLPVTTLLQPRDYINAWQLFIAMGLLAAGVAVSALTGKLHLVAPPINHNLPAGTLPIFPFMFVIIACGAISGFHSLVASGTTPKQVATESDSLFVGYGSMLLEGLLAVLVILCVGAGIGMALEIEPGQFLTGSAAWQHQYSSWIGTKGLVDKIAPVVNGAANMMASIGLPKSIGITLMGVFIASFASTTLDTSVRLQRYVVSELACDLKIKVLAGRWAATTFAVLTAAVLAFAKGAGATGAMILWPLFGTANQLLAALSLLVVTIYLKRKGGLKFVFTAIPCLIMLAITNICMITNEINFINKNDWPLIVIGAVIFILALWMTIEAVVTFFNRKTRTAKS